MFRLIITATMALALTSLMSACSLQVYQKQVQQGNIVTQDMLAQLKPGMNQRQVAYIMGNPVVADPFTKSHWDYMYRIERNLEDALFYQVRVYFDGAGNYSHYEGNTDLILVHPQEPSKSDLYATDEDQ